MIRLNNRLWVVIIIISLNFFISCSKSPQLSTDLSSQTNLSVEIIDTLYLNQINSDLNIARVRRFVATQPNGTKFALIDDMSNKISVFDLNGTLINSFGNRGRGPEEFVRINSFGMDEYGNIITYDSALDLIRIFTFTGELIHSFGGLLGHGLWNRGSRITAFEGRLYFSIEESEFSNHGNFWLSSLVAVFDYNGELLSLMGSHDPINYRTEYLYKYGLHGFDFQNGSIYTQHRIGNLIQEFELYSLEPKKRFGFKPSSFLVWNDEASINDAMLDRRVKNVSQSFTNNPFVCERYILHYFQNMSMMFYQTQNPFFTDYYFGVYDKKSKNYLGELFFEGLIPLGVTFDCKVITLKSDNPDEFTLVVQNIIQN